MPIEPETEGERVLLIQATLNGWSVDRNDNCYELTCGADNICKVQLNEDGTKARDVLFPTYLPIDLLIQKKVIGRMRMKHLKRQVYKREK